MSAELSFPQGPVEDGDDTNSFNKSRKKLSFPQKMPHEIEAERLRQWKLKNKVVWEGLPQDDDEENEAA